MNAAIPCRTAYAPRFRLYADLTVSTAFEEILRHCLANVIDNEGAAISRADSEGVHQMRVALRRIPSALSVFEKYFSPEDVRRLSEETKWLAACLGDALDWDVFTAEGLGAGDGERSQRPALFGVKGGAGSRNR